VTTNAPGAEVEVGTDGFPITVTGEENDTTAATATAAAHTVRDSGTKMHVSHVIPDIRLLKLSRNHGKGGAIKRGVLNSRGAYILFADADGATDVTYLDALLQQLYKVQIPLQPALLKSGSLASKPTVPATAPLHGLVVGSRAHLASQSIAVRKWYRTVLMHGFHFLVKLVLNAGGSGGSALVKDTQCGFKLFTRQTARLLFTNLHLEGWVFDIELLYLADHMHIPVAEVAVAWKEVDGSKLIRNKFDVVFTSLRMARDMTCMRIAYMIDLWKPIYLG
jgi:dolichyl-phosphate beta-glucosyltransferase